MNEPPIPDPCAEPDAALPVMTCPYCGHKLELTWGRYWRSPTGKHRCPECRQVSKVGLPVGLGGLRLVVVISLVLPLVIAGFDSPVIALWLPSYLAITIPLDKYLDGRFGILKKIQPR